MSGTYFPYFMKQALREAQGDIQHLLSSLRDTGFHKGAVSLDDVPAIIKTLEFHDPETRELAQRTLAKLAGSDFGPSPNAWQNWWKTQGEKLRERHRLEDTVENAFKSFRALIMEGDWAQAAEFLHEDALGGAARTDVINWLTEHKKDVRRAYRDASGTLTSIASDKASIGVLWGEYGYQINEVHLVRVGEQWLFTSTPWEGLPIITKADDSDIDALAHEMAGTQTKSRHLRIQEGLRQLEEEEKGLFAKRNTPVAVGISVFSAILVGISTTIYLAQGRDPKIASSMSYLGLFVGAIYGVVGASIILSRPPQYRLILSLTFLVGAVLLVVLMHR